MILHYKSLIPAYIFCVRQYREQNMAIKYHQTDWDMASGMKCLAAMLLLVTSLIKTATSDLTASACFNQTRKSLSMSCPAGHMIMVSTVIQGHNTEGRCTYVEGDCTYEMKSSSYACVGRQTCDVNLPSGDTGFILHMCGAHASYMQIQYRCIPTAATNDICDTPRLVGEMGYISSPRYPNNYPSDQLCTLRIQAPLDSQKLRLYIIDLTLESDPENSTGDWLYLNDGHRGHTLSGTRAREEVMVTMENYVDFTFQSNGQNRQKGFWLYFEADPYLNLTTPSPTSGTTSVPWLVLLSNRSSHTVTMPTTTETQDISHIMPRLGFPIGLLVGILLGALICALIIVLIIIILKRRRLKMAQSASCASNMAIMASQLSKQIPPQTIHNTLQPDMSCSLEKPDNREFPYKASKPKEAQLYDKDVEIAMDIRKPAGPYNGRYIEKHFETGEDQLFC